MSKRFHRKWQDQLQMQNQRLMIINLCAKPFRYISNFTNFGLLSKHEKPEPQKASKIEIRRRLLRAGCVETIRQQSMSKERKMILLNSGLWSRVKMKLMTKNRMKTKEDWKMIRRYSFPLANAAVIPTSIRFMNVY